MRVDKLTIDKESLWDDYVDQHSEATFFHRSGWKRVIMDSMGHKSHYLMAFDDNKVAGVYPLFILPTGLFGFMGVSLPYVNYGGILADSVEAEKLLIDEAEKIGIKSGCSYIELRQRFPLKLKLPLSEHKISSVIPLKGGPDEVFSRLHSNVRNKIRKAKKNGVIVQSGTEYLDDFYEVYARNLRDLGTPVISRNFFEKIVEEFPMHVKIFRALKAGKTIGAKVTFMDIITCYFEFSASRRDSLGHAPVQIMNWEAIKLACARGCKYIDFGKSTIDSSHQSFKKYWGIETQVLPWAYQLLTCNDMPGFKKENPKFALAISLWKKMPLSLSRILGPPIARRLP